MPDRVGALEDALRQSQIANAHLQALTQHLRDGLLLLDAAGTVLLVNEQYCQLLELPGPASHWTGQPLEALVALVRERVADPAAYLAELATAREAPGSLLNALLPLRSGRLLARDVVQVPLGEGTGWLLSCRDVTAQHAGEAQLRLLARISEQNPNPIMRFNGAGERVYANPATFRFAERLAPAEVQALRSSLRAVAARSLQLAEPQELEVQAGEMLMQVFVAPFPAEDYVNVYLVDITARHAAERQVREQQQFTQLVLDTAPSAIYVRDDAGAIVFSNRAMQALTADMQDLPARAAANPAGVEAWEMAQHARADARVLATGQQVTSEDRLTLGPDDVRWFHTVKRPLPRPDGRGLVLGVSTDITATKEAQFSLAHTEKQYRDLARYSQALICTHDLNGVMLSVSPAVAQMMGAPAEALVGQPLSAGVPPALRPQVAAYLALMAQRDEHSGLLQVQTISGETRYLLYHNYRVQENGQTTHVVGYGQDITARIQAEQATMRARDEAEATARARENFLANMSHEIRTPMNGVLGMTAQLAKTRLDPRQQELVDVIQQSGQHLLGVLNDVLDMAKITAGQLELEEQAFNLCDSMGAAVQGLALQAQEKGLEFVGTSLRDTCPMPWVLGDAHRLNQVLINLVSNAVKFTAQGRVTVRGEQLAETADSLTVRFSVQDTGPGIDPDKQAHIFESFTQAYADTARRHGGTGLGLSISRALVAQMGGELTLASAVGEGSTFAFTLTLPKAPAAAERPDEAAAYDTGHLVGARVLLVEDNDINRLVARMMLEPWGVRLDEATDGPAALTQLDEQTYDVVLMDIQLPGMNGVEITQRLRQMADAKRAATPVIALTANAFRADVDGYLANGFNDYLAKPFEEEELYRKIEALLPAAVPAYDLTQLRHMAQGRPVFVERILRSFLANMPTSLAQLRGAAAAADWPAVARLVHHIKPNLQALAVVGTAEPVALLERLHQAATAGGEAPAPAALTPAVELLLLAVERALRELPGEEGLLPAQG